MSDYTGVGLDRCRIIQGLLYLSLSEKNAGDKWIDRTISLATITSLSSPTQTFNLKEKFTMIVINDKYILYTFFILLDLHLRRGFKKAS